MATLASNRAYANNDLMSIAEEYEIPKEWVTQRQASKFRMKRGRIYKAMRDKIQEKKLESLKAEK